MDRIRPHSPEVGGISLILPQKSPTPGKPLGVTKNRGVAIRRGGALAPDRGTERQGEALEEQHRFGRSRSS